MRILHSIIFCFFVLISQSQNNSQIINTSGKTIAERFLLPSGFVRIDNKNTTYDDYLRNLKLKPADSKVYLYDKKLKNRQDVHEAVIDIEVGNKDLQQCADAVMRIRAEYLYHTIHFDRIHFNFTNGSTAEYVKYAEGYRYNAKTNSWNKTAKVDYTYETFKKFLELVFTYAGSLSLSKELVPVNNVNDIQPGDVFIKGGSPGHAVIVIDVAKNPETNLTLFMIAQSYMPAQNIHVLKNFNSIMISPWYSTNFGFTLDTPEWSFKKSELMRFKD